MTRQHYRPKVPFTTVAELFNPTVTVIKGVTVKSYTKVDDINCSFRTYGGTETLDNGVLTIIDTATIETWYRPDITASSQIKVNGKTYEVICDVEDIELRHQFLKFKVRGVRGGT